jgi:cellulose synthase (UDP-forming)
MPQSHSDTVPFNADDTLISLDSPGTRLLTRATGVTALLMYASYLVYRAAFTLNPDALVFSLAVFAAEVHGFFSLFLFFHQTWHLRGRRVVAAEPGLRVDVFITTYNEDVELLRQTVRAAVAIRYPHNTYVLDDGRRAAVRALAEEIGCRYMTRDDNAHAKAGNFNNAFRQTDADLIAVFDADHVASPEFLDRTLGFFRDAKVAIVQVPQQYHNLDSVQHSVSWKTRRMYGEQDAFFNLVMPGKDNWNAAFFCGTGAVLRRKALEPLGGILADTITEDLHTSIELHAAGWKSVYLNEVLVTGLAPQDLKSFAAQRLRWAEGNLKAGLFSNPVTLKGLSARQRISYIASLYHWTLGAPKLVYYLAPAWMLFTRTFPIAHFDRTFVGIYLAFLTSLILSYHIVSRGKGRLLMDELFNMVSFFTLLQAMKRVAFGRGKPSRFVVTSKRGSGARDFGPVLPHLALLAFSALAISWSVMSLGFGITDDVFGAGVAMFWTLYNGVLMGIVVAIGTRPSEKRAACRFRANFAVEAMPGSAHAGQLGVTADIAEGGCALLWPEPLAAGARLPVRVYLGPHQADWIVDVVSELGRQPDGWYRLGIRFADLRPADVDLINDTVFSIVVPQYFAWLSEPGWFGRWLRTARAVLAHRFTRRAPRQQVQVPLRVRHADGTFVTTLRDVSATGLSFVSPCPLAEGAHLSITISAAGRTLTTAASVVRVDERLSRRAFETWEVSLQFVEALAAASVEPFQLEEAA